MIMASGRLIQVFSYLLLCVELSDYNFHNIDMNPHLTFWKLNVQSNRYSDALDYMKMSGDL